MKRTILPVILVLLLLLLPAALADEARDVKLSNVGLHFSIPGYPDAFAGMLDIPYSEQADNEGNVFLTYIQYYPKSSDDLAALESKINDPDASAEESENLVQEFVNSAVPLMIIYTLRDETQLNSLFDEWKKSNPGATSTEIGEADGYHFYLFDRDLTEDLAGLKAPFAEDCQKIYDVLRESLAHAEFFAPLSAEEQNNGKQLSFVTNDLDGNPISSDELFAQHKITMVNVWATWCPPCKAELPELANIHHRLAEKDCAIVGILLDSENPGAIEEAQSLLKDAGADYTNLLCPEGFDMDLQIGSIPTSFMVDRNGVILSSVVGAYIDQYEPLIDSLLGQQ
ncbi:MAG: TlpA family protein disulfide reductase [Clostridia bacterium]|nr:TlpA family protein disulfide reductase [Clostridia bacterium]